MLLADLTFAARFSYDLSFVVFVLTNNKQFVALRQFYISTRGSSIKNFAHPWSRNLPILDLPKAFDTINHEILLKKICNYCIRGTLYDWFKSYLFGKTKQVEYHTYLFFCTSRFHSRAHYCSCCTLMISPIYQMF